MEKQNFKDFNERLNTFNTWPRYAPVFIKDLAEAGFVFSGNADEVYCFSCGIKKSNWNESDNPLSCHEEINRNCFYLLERSKRSFLSNDNNSDHQSAFTRPINESMRFEKKRFLSFALCPVNKHWPLPDDLASAGFYWIDSERCMKCFCCDLIMDSWESADQDVMQRHRANSAQCALVKGEACGNVLNGESILDQPVSAVFDNLYITPQRKEQPPIQVSSSDVINNFKVSDCKRINEPISSHNITVPSFQSRSQVNPHITMFAEPPEEFEQCDSNAVIKPDDYSPSVSDLSNFNKRLKTFTTWPASSPMQPFELCHAGFYYTKKGDIVKCYVCKQSLHNFEHGDIAWNEHLKFSPNCPLLKSKLSDDFLPHNEFQQQQYITSPAAGTAGYGTTGNGTAKNLLLQNYLVDNQYLMKKPTSVDGSIRSCSSPLTQDFSSPHTQLNYNNIYRNNRYHEDQHPVSPHRMPNNTNDYLELLRNRYPVSSQGSESVLRDNNDIYQEPEFPHQNRNHQSAKPFFKPAHIENCAPNATNRQNYNQFSNHELPEPMRHIENYTTNHNVYNIPINNNYTPIMQHVSPTYSPIVNDQITMMNNQQFTPVHEAHQHQQQQYCAANTYASILPVSENMYASIDENRPNYDDQHQYENAKQHYPNPPHSGVHHTKDNNGDLTSKRRVSESDIDNLLDLGYSRELIEKTMKCYKGYSPQNFKNRDELIQAVIYFKKHETLEGTPFGRTLNVDADQVAKCDMIVDKAVVNPLITPMENQQKCTVCLDNNLEVRLGPCGHLCVCVSCAYGLKQCPICRQDVKSTQRTFIV